MKRVILSLLLLVAVGCGDDRSSLGGPWAYSWQKVSATLAGRMLLLPQPDGRLEGGIDAPDGYHDGWDWGVEGSIDGDRVLLFAYNRGSTDLPWGLDCKWSPGILDCSADIAGWEPQRFTFSATQVHAPALTGVDAN